MPAEILAAVVSALLSGLGTSAMMVSSRAREGQAQRREDREIVLRLTVAVENVAQRLEELHNDIKADRREMYGRLSELEQRTARLEAQQRTA